MIADQTPNFLVKWYVSESEGSSNVWQQEENDEITPFVHETVIKKDTYEDADRDKDAVGHLERISSAWLSKLGFRKQAFHTCIRVVTKVEKPNPPLMMVPKLLIPPLVMLPTTPRMKNK